MTLEPNTGLAYAGGLTWLVTRLGGIWWCVRGYEKIQLDVPAGCGLAEAVRRTEIELGDGRHLS